MVRAGDLKDNPANWRRHPPGQLSALRNLIADPEVGWAAPLLYNERTKRLIDGHARKRVVGADEFVPVLIGSWSEEAEKKILATLDPLAAMAEADPAALQSLLAEVDLKGPDLEALAADLDELLADAEAGGGEGPPVVEDEPPEPQKKAVSKMGDLWILGDHRLLCGDATKEEDVTRLMMGGKAAMLFTDPPWNVAIGGDANPRHRQRPGLQNDDLSPAGYQAFLESWIALVPASVGGDVYCVLGASEWPRLDAVLRASGFHWSATVIWVKDIFVLGRSKYHRRYEPIWYGWHTSGASSFCERRDLDDVWECPRPHRSDDHPTMKPVAIVARAIENSSGAGAGVLDPFLGSGTTIIAAEQLGRWCYGMEIEPRYVDVAVRRWQTFTGKEAVLEKGGRTFEEVAKSRGRG